MWQPVIDHPEQFLWVWWPKVKIEKISKTQHNSWPFLTFVVDLESYRSHALIWLQVKPHLMGHADYQIRNKATREAGAETKTIPVKLLLSCGQQWKVWVSSLQSKRHSKSQLRKMKLLEHQRWESLLWLSLLFFFAKRSHRKARRSQYVHTIQAASSFSGLWINSDRHQREFKSSSLYNEKKKAV